MRASTIPMWLAALALSCPVTGLAGTLLAARGEVRAGARAGSPLLPVGTRLSAGSHVATASDGAAEVLVGEAVLLRLGPATAIALRGPQVVEAVEVRAGRLRAAAVGPLRLVAGGVSAETVGGVLLAEARAGGARLCLLRGAATAGPRGASRVPLAEGQCLGDDGARSPLADEAAFPTAASLVPAPAIAGPL